MKRVFALVLAGLSVMPVTTSPAAARERYIGDLMMAAFEFCPRGWEKADGRLLPINENPALFAVIEARYGGDGRTNFALPDLRGRVAVGTGQGNEWGEFAATGQRGGRESVDMTYANLPPHSHEIRVTLAGEELERTDNAYGHGLRGDFPDFPVNIAPTTDAGYVAMARETVTRAGRSDARINISAPSLALTYCINTTGIYPSGN